MSVEGEAAPASTSAADAAPVEPANRRRRRTRAAAAMALQVALIAIGVFLGLAGEEWRQDRENRRLAAEALRRFRAELVTNREIVMGVKDYHAERLEELNRYFAAPVETRDATIVQYDGIQPPFLESTAWEVALATESINYIDVDLAFALSRTYRYQDVANELGRALASTMYARPPNEANSNFFGLLQLYYGDLSGLEPILVVAYDELIPAIDGALAE